MLHRRRRGVPVTTSTRRKLCPSIGKLLGTPTPLPRLNEPASPDRHHAAQGGGPASLTAERHTVRQEKAKPLVTALKTWLEKTLAQLAGGSSIAQAIRYGLSRWDGLVRFLDDGRIEINSNTVERSMRPIALSRKNALFAGSDHGAENWAMLASLIETCKLHGVNPEAYFTDVLTKLVNNWPNRRLAELTPWAWAADTR